MAYELEIAGMTCLNCARTLERALASVPGVEHASVSYPAKRATVVAGPQVGAEALRDAVARAGYRATVVGDAAAAPAPRDTSDTSDTGDTGVGEAMATAAPAHTAPAQQGRTDRTGVDYDLVIIGSGGAGMAAAIRASELGATAAVVEGADVVGGTCVNVGCIPSKNLIEAAHHYHAARTGFPGIAACAPQLAWDRLLRQKREIVESLRREKYLDVLEAYDGVTLLGGRATLAAGRDDDGAVVVRVGEGGVRAVRARKVVIATGARPAVPPIPGLAEVGALDSTSVMELERLPASLLVIGGGSIGLELGQAFQRFGVRVVVVEALDRILPGEDPDVSAVLAQALIAEGLEIHTGTRVTRATRTGAGVRLDVEQGRLRGQLEAARLLVATGRVPNTDGLGLDAAGVETDARGFVAVDEFMRTSRPRIFAAGDVTGGPQFVYVAALEGGVAAQAALAELVGEEAIPADLGTLPRVTFTDPQVAAVGLTEVAARAAGLAPEVTALPVESLPRAAVSHRRRGTVRLVSEAGTDRLLGAHVVAPNAGDFIGEAVLAVRFGLTTRDLVSTLHPYLTWGEALRLAAQTFTKDVAKLSCCA